MENNNLTLRMMILAAIFLAMSGVWVDAIAGAKKSPVTQVEINRTPATDDADCGLVLDDEAFELEALLEN